MKSVTIRISCDDPEDDKAVRRLVSADRVYFALHDIHNDVFRPARKHGYADPGMQALMDKAGDVGVELVGALERMFFSILEDHQVTTDDC